MSSSGGERVLGIEQRSLFLNRELSFLPVPSNRREVGILWYRALTGERYVGEVAPLPRFSGETLSEALDEWRGIQHLIPPLEEVSLACDGVWGIFLGGVRCPSLRCGLEGLALDYLVRDEVWCAAHIVNPSIACNALVVPQAGTSLADQISAAMGRGFSSIKIKVSPETIEDVLPILGVLSRDNPLKVRWRLDPNRSFSSDEFMRIVPRCAGVPIEYIEEPVRDTDQLPRLIAESPIPLALDETTRELPATEWLRWGARYVVLKPTLNGGLLSLLPLISRIAASGGRVTLSSSFESGIGLRAIALLASLIPNCGAVGLDTASFLREDLLIPRFPSGAPTLLVSELREARCKGEFHL